MKLSLGQNQFFDDAGRPLSGGSVSVYLHDSDTFANVYTLDGTVYREAENPITCGEDGRIPTLFFEASVVDVKIKDSDGVVVDTFQAGATFPSVKNDTIVEGIAGLKDANPSLGSVTVVGYDSDVMAPARVYVWDADSTDTPDDGIVVASSVDGAVGNWILLWDSPTLPATIYGVAPGHEANLSALVSYASVVGSFGLATPPCVFFPAGTYTSNTSFSTPKSLVFDKSAKFTRATFSCQSVEVIGKNTSYIADFTFPSGNSFEAHSSWFRTNYGFWNSGAQILYIDKDVYFTSSSITDITVTGAIIRGNSLMHYQFQMGFGLITFNGCKIEAQGIFDDKIRVKFQNMREFKESWWQDQNPSKFKFVSGLSPLFQPTGGAIEFLPATNGPNIVGNVLDIADFTNPDIYLKALSVWMSAVALAPKKVDLEGRTVSSVPLCVATEYSNMTVLGDMYLPTTGTVTLRNVTCLGEVHGGGNCVCYNCTLNWRELPTTLNAYDSTVGAAVQVTGDFPLVCEGCDVHFNINNATDNTTARSQTIMRGCRLTQANGLLKTKNLYLENCICENQVIEIYPYKDGGVYKTKFFASCCSFLSAYPVKVTKVHTVGGVEDTDCHHVKLDLTVTGNSFNGNDRGISVDYWGVKNTYKLFFALIGNTVEYSGNSGKCPAEKPCGQWSNLSTITATLFYDEFAGTFTGYVCDKVLHVWPDFSDEGIVSANVGWAYPDTFAYVIATMWSRGIFLDAIMSRLTSDNYGDACNFGYMNTGDPSATGALRVV